MKVKPLGQAEVADVGVALRVDQDVRWLEVPVEDPAVVSGMDRPADRNQQPSCVEPRHRAVGQPPRQGRPFDVLHREEGLPLMLTHLEHWHDMGMSELRGGQRLDAEPLHILGP